MKLSEIYSHASTLVALEKAVRGTHKTFFRLNIEPIMKDLREFEAERKVLAEDAKENPDNLEKNNEEVVKMAEREITISIEEPLTLEEIQGYDLSIPEENSLIELGIVNG
jgi:hypothetical protein